MPTQEMEVLDQDDAKGTRFSCGFHAVKNGLLGLLYQQGHINEARMKALACPQEEVDDALENSTDDSVDSPQPEAIQFFNHLYDEITRVMFNGEEDLRRDLSIAHIKECMTKLKAGDIDLSGYGITNQMLTNLDYSQMTAFNMPFTKEGEFGNDTIEAALSFADLAMADEDRKHVFAVGSPGVGHWATVFMEKSVEGEVGFSFLFMDSFGSVSVKKVTQGIEAVLTKSKDEIREYLLDVYDADNYQFSKMYHRFFDLDGNVKLDGQYNDSIIDDVTDFIGYEEYIRRNGENWAASVQEKFNVLVKADLLDNPSERTQDYMHQLINVATVIEQVYEQESQLINATVDDLEFEAQAAARQKLATMEDIRQSMTRIHATLMTSIFPEENSDETKDVKLKAATVEVQLENITARLEKLDASIDASNKLITQLKANQDRTPNQNNLLAKAKEGLVKKMGAKESLDSRKADLVAMKNQAFKQKLKIAVQQVMPEPESKHDLPKDDSMALG